MEKPDLIFKAAQDGVSGNIGIHLLENPVKKVDINLKAKKDTFNLQGKVLLDYDLNYKPIDKPTRLAIAERYRQNNQDGKIVERGGHLIITAPKGTKLVLGEGSIGLSDIAISTGLVQDYITDKLLQLVPAPLSTRESFDNVLADFNEVLRATVEEAYKQKGKISPNEELVLHPPEVDINDKRRQGDAVFGDVETPKNLLGKIEIEKPNVRFEDIGGQKEAKREIEGLAFALKNPDLYRKWGTKPPKGIILYGPPGTGKTLMARALASQADARFFHVQASDIGSKWYGESPKIVQSIFELAAKTGEKTIIFFDEIDAVAPPREGSHEATQKTVSELLIQMDGMVGHDNVMVVASTNRLESVDPALLRAGRFDRWVEVPLPDEEGRKQILDIHMKKTEEIAGRTLFNQIDAETVVSKMDQSSGADIAEIIRRVLEEKVRQEGMGKEASSVSTEDILREIKGYEKVRETKKRLGFQTTPRTNLKQEEASQ